MIEKIHMKERLMGVQFSIKNREAKNRYIDANVKNVITELSVDIKNYGLELALRKLLLSLISTASSKYWCRPSCSNRGALLLHEKE
jgi:hypothetical protein